jgi:hypothetical protein
MFLIRQKWFALPARPDLARRGPAFFLQMQASAAAIAAQFPCIGAPYRLSRADP